MPLLDMAKIIQKSCERWKATLVHWRRELFHMSTEKIQGSGNCGQGKEEGFEGEEKELYNQQRRSPESHTFLLGGKSRGNKDGI